LLELECLVLPLGVKNLATATGSVTPPKMLSFELILYDIILSSPPSIWSMCHL